MKSTINQSVEFQTQRKHYENNNQNLNLNLQKPLPPLEFHMPYIAKKNLLSNDNQFNPDCEKVIETQKTGKKNKNSIPNVKLGDLNIYEYKPILQNQFIRDNMDVKDINDKKNFYQDFQFGVKQIEPHKFEASRKKNVSVSVKNSLNVQDINQDFKYKFKSKRVTDVFNPQYDYGIQSKLKKNPLQQNGERALSYNYNPIKNKYIEGLNYIEPIKIDHDKYQQVNQIAQVIYNNLQNQGQQALKYNIIKQQFIY